MTHYIPANYPWSAVIYLGRKTAQETDYSTITDPDAVPGSGWALHLVGDGNRSAYRWPIDWSAMDESGCIRVSLTAEETQSLRGRRLKLAARFDDMPSDLVRAPEDIFYFVTNDIR